MLDHQRQNSRDPHDHRTAVDQLDLAILGLLVNNARMPNSELASRVGIAPSTCLRRVRALVNRGTISRFRTDVDLSQLGVDVQAVVSVRLQPGARKSLRGSAQALSKEPGVQSVFFVGGTYDFLIHVAVESTAQLRDFVATKLSGNPGIESTSTNIVFESLTGTNPAGLLDHPQRQGDA